uniref:Chaperonin-like RbcX protein n=1 Tax=Kalanchoe fedtschenkoi TaxID=63787 RepID=A0A7N0TJM8_KALFE
MMIQALSISSPSLAASLRRREAASRKGLAKLSSPFLWTDSRISARMLWQIVNRLSRRQMRVRKMEIVDELGGQYEHTFNDVKLQIRNYFTFKAVRTVLHQLYEMNPSEYTWFYNYIATNRPGEGKRFLQALAKERQVLAERVMVTRLHLYAKWIKICDHEKIYKEISDENLELMRERLMETVIWPVDDDDNC